MREALKQGSGFTFLSFWSGFVNSPSKEEIVKYHNQMYILWVSVSSALFSEILLRRTGSQQAAKFLSNIFTVGQISDSPEF